MDKNGYIVGQIYGEPVSIITDEDWFVLDLFFDFHALFKLYELDAEAVRTKDKNPKHNSELIMYF